MIHSLRPKDTLADHEVQTGLRSLTLDGMCSYTLAAMTGGAFLVAFALHLGASNKIIGLLAAIGPLAQILQIPAIYLVDRTGHRKAVVVGSAFVSRLFWIPIILLPWIVPERYRLQAFLLALLAHFAFGAIAMCAFSSWMRDLIPETIRGSYFAHRLSVSTALSAVLSLIAALSVDAFLINGFPPELVYGVLFSIGTAAGLLGIFFLSRIPEPRMTLTPVRGLIQAILEPFGDVPFLRLLKFLGAWSFAVNLAAPFFTVYMLRQLGLSMTVVLALSVCSQAFNIAFLRIWGRLSDRFSNKSVLIISGPQFMISILLWVFTTIPDSYLLTFPLLILIHALAGMSTAGVTLCSGNIALKAAPQGRATAYLATNAFVCGIAATLAPLIAGFLADGFADTEIALNIRWITGGNAGELPAVSIGGLDFVFLISFFTGLYALHRLSMVEEEGEAEEDVVTEEFYAEVRRSLREVSNVAGFRRLTDFPYAKIREILSRKS